jgi:hypothetical protein
VALQIKANTKKYNTNDKIKYISPTGHAVKILGDPDTVNARSEKYQL